MEFKGIDVSKWQGNINWNEVKKDETEFAHLQGTQNSMVITV